MKRPKSRVDFGVGKAWVAFINGPFEPGECLVGLAAHGANLSDLIGVAVGILSNQFFKCVIRIGHISRGVVNYRLCPSLPEIVGFEFGIDKRFLDTTLVHQH